MNIVFFGNPHFASNALNSLIEKKYDINLVVTNPDKKMGRGLKYNSTELKKNAILNNLPILEIDDFNESGIVDELKKNKPDLFIVVAYRILPKHIYDIPRLYTINLHASLLPKYRGASPIQYALLNGDKYTGLSTFVINDNIDTGDIIFQKKIKMNDKMNFNDLYNLLCDSSGEVLHNTIQSIISEKKIVSQDNSVISKAPKIKKKDFVINWNDSASNIHNKIRGLSYLGAYSFYKNKRVKFFNSHYINSQLDQINLDKIGSFSFLDNKLYIKAKTGYVIIYEIQIEGKKRTQINSMTNYDYFKNEKESNIFENEVS